MRPSADDIWRFRCWATREYFDFVQRAVDEGAEAWIVHHNNIRTLAIYEIMALLHPSIYLQRQAYVEQSSNSFCPIRGLRSFRKVNFPPHVSCGASELWEFSCGGPWRHTSSLGVAIDERDVNILLQDHLFPYSLGGVTTVENQLVLCGLHNAVKAHDVHIWPWEKWHKSGTAPTWALDALSRIRPLMY